MAWPFRSLECATYQVYCSEKDESFVLPAEIPCAVVTCVVVDGIRRMILLLESLRVLPHADVLPLALPHRPGVTTCTPTC